MLDWIPRESGKKNHGMWLDAHFGTEAPCTMFEKRPLQGPDGKVVDGLYVGWIILNNPKQYNSYTTEMVKGVIAGFQRASADPSIVAAVFTGVGDKAFCTGGNTKEYAEYYSMRPQEYGDYMDLFNGMVDAILNCKKPTICRVNGMRVAGGQEIGMANDLAISSDLAIFGQAGPKHGSAPDGGSSDFLPWYMSMENAMWNCVSCEMWSAYKMKQLGVITKAVSVIRDGDKWVRNPQVITDKWIDDGEIVYGEFKTGAEAREAREFVKNAQIDFTLLDQAVNEVVWKFANLMPHCLMKSIDSVRAKKKFFWDQMKLPNRHWLAANMNYEAYMGFNAFNTKRITGQDTIDFIKYRQLVAEGQEIGDELHAQVFAKPLDK